MTNQQIAKILLQIADYYEIKKDRFRTRAYQRAAATIEGFDDQISAIYKEKGTRGLLEIPGVGAGIAGHIEELIKTGHLKLLEKFEKKLPVDMTELTGISGIGPATVKVLYEKLGIKNLVDLKRAIGKHEIRDLPGFGKKSEDALREGLQFKTQNSGRYLLGEIYPVAESLKVQLLDSGLFEKLEIAGSYRRRQETMGDIDILGTSSNPGKATEAFAKLKETTKVLQRGETKSAIRLGSGIQVDLRIVPPESYGAALQYFTGDKAHNIHLRKIAIAKKLKLSEYGLYRGEKQIAGRTEEDIYQALGMDYIPPEIRTDTGEIEAALRPPKADQGKPGGLPKLLEYGSVRGDLQVQTNWTDGTASIEEMAKAAIALGREYIAITDHTKTLYMTHGLDERRLVLQMKEIDKLNLKFKSAPYTPSLSKRGKGEFRILKGAEVNILKDGSLDINDETLARLDVVGVSLHSNFKMPARDMTRRIVRALSNPNVDIFFHPTTRIINRRPPVEFDFDEVLKAAKKNHVALEVNAHPWRLDLHDTLIRKAVAAGVKLVIDSDAHHPNELDYLHFGEAQARRGWATADDILNTKSVDELLKFFKGK